MVVVVRKVFIVSVHVHYFSFFSLGLSGYIGGMGRGAQQQGRDRDRTGTRQGQDRDKSGARQRKVRDKIREGKGMVRDR